MRIIAGSAGGIRLLLPKHAFRPTMDRVREAVFSALGDRVPGARVLDLFAGSGAYGLEALSRGAASVRFVDRHRAATDAIRANLARARLLGEVQQLDAYKFLRQANGPYDLVFADPPYTKNSGEAGEVARLLADPHLPALLSPSALLILERLAGGEIPPLPGWNLDRPRRYGKTEILFLSRAGESP